MSSDRIMLQRALRALRRLSDAALARESTMGDPCRLIEVKAELAEARKQADALMRNLWSEYPDQVWPMGYPEPPQKEGPPPEPPPIRERNTQL